MSDEKRLQELLEAVRRHCHELRQPLLGIHGYAEMMATAPADQRLVSEAAAQVAAQADRIARMVDDLAELAGNMAGRPVQRTTVPADTTARTEVRPPVEEAIKLFGYRTGSTPTLSADLPPDLPAVRIAPDHLERIAINLVSNALEAGGGAVSVRARRDGGQVLLEVADDGPGVSAEVRKRLFAPGITTKGKAHGLGLAICRELARAAGGDLVLATASDLGPPWPHRVTTVFRLMVPAAS